MQYHAIHPLLHLDLYQKPAVVVGEHLRPLLSESLFSPAGSNSLHLSSDQYKTLYTFWNQRKSNAQSNLQHIN